jgi:hypothetical protein
MTLHNLIVADFAALFTAAAVVGVFCAGWVVGALLGWWGR